MRSAQLLTVAAQYPEFPIVLETMRECLNDVFDLDGLLRVQRALASRSMRLVEVETKEPSPFAKSLLFGYVGAFVYEGDVPLAEKKAAALSLDATLLAELLGKDGLKQLLDAGIIASTEADLQGLSTERQATTTEQLFDLLRTAGPFTLEELRRRSSAARASKRSGRFDQLVTRPPASVEVRIAAQDMIAVVEDVPRLRDGLGIPVPPGVAASFTETAAHPIADLVLRWARTHGPFTAVDHRAPLRTRAGGRGAGLESSGRARHAGLRVLRRLDGEAGHERRQYCHSQVLALIKRRTLALLRKGVEPVEQVAYARFLADWQGIGAGARGTDAVLVDARATGRLSDARECSRVGHPARPGRRLHPGHVGRADVKRRGLLGGRRADRRQRRLGPLVHRRHGSQSGSRPGRRPPRSGAARCFLLRWSLLLRRPAPGERWAGRPRRLRRGPLAPGLGRPGHR